MMRPLNIRIPRLQPRVAAIDYAGIVAQPHADFVKAHAVAGEQTGHGVTHGVRRYPPQFLLCYVLVEWPAEIVTVAIFAVLYLRMQHEWLSESVPFEESEKFSRERNCALFAIFELHRGSPSQMEKAVLEIKPERARLDNFLLSQSGVESAVQDKLQIFILRGANQFVALLFRAEIAQSNSFVFVFGLVDTVAWVSPADASDTDRPREKRAQDRRVSIGRRGRVRGLCRIVKSLHVCRRDVERRNLVNLAGERAQDETAAVRARNGELVLAAFIGEEGCYFRLEGTACVEIRIRPHLACARHSLGVVTGFQADKVSFAGALEIQPVDRTPEIDAFRGRILHSTECDIAVTSVNPECLHIPGISPPVELAGDETRTRDVLLGKVVVCRGDCHAGNVTEGQL